MNFTGKPMQDLATFRAETRQWLEDNCPPSMRTPMSDKEKCWGGRNWTFHSEDQKLWMERMAARGWTAPTWPTEYGGGGLSKDEAKILREEMARITARNPLNSMGISMIGPAILQFGSEALKRQHLPPIVRGEIRWCQGYSEPNAGSDLAGLQVAGHGVLPADAVAARAGVHCKQVKVVVFPLRLSSCGLAGARRLYENRVGIFDVWVLWDAAADVGRMAPGVVVVGVRRDRLKIHI